MLRQLGSEVLRLWLAIHRLKYELVQWLDAVPLVLNAAPTGNEQVGKVATPSEVSSLGVAAETQTADVSAGQSRP